MLCGVVKFAMIPCTNFVSTKFRLSELQFWLLCDVGHAGRTSGIEKCTVLSTPAELLTSQAMRVGAMWAPFNRFPVWFRNIGRLMPPVPVHNIKLCSFTFAQAQPGHSTVVVHDSRFVNENVFRVIFAVNETVTILDIVPFDGTKDAFSKDNVFCGI